MDLMRLGSTSLQNIQQALTTTGNNITNANTEGYSRQSVEFQARQSQRFGYGYLGQGAYISSIERSTNDFMTRQVQSFSAGESRYSAYLEYSTRLDDLLADSDNSISASMQQFWNSVQEVTNNPAGVPERQLLLSGANNMVQRLQTLDKSLRSLGQEINSQLKTTVGEINGLTESIRQLNLQIVSASAANSAAPPNDLLDRRDLMLMELSQKVGITVVSQDDGSVNVFAGKGQPLVVGNQISKLETRANPYDNSKLEVAFTTNSGGNIVSQFLDGGELAGLLEFRDRNMVQVESRVGLLALTLSGEFNAQHQKGIDLLSNQGGQFFTAPTATITARSGNLGTSTPALTVVDATAVRASEYRLTHDGTQWHLQRMSDGTTVNGSGVLTLDGMSVDTTVGIPLSGDTFSFNPAREAVQQLSVLVRDPQKIAAASALRSTTAGGNGGNGKLESVQVSDSTLLPLPSNLTIAFNANALGDGVPGFVLSGAVTGTLAYNPALEGAGKDFTLTGLGISFRFSGTPAAGDSFTIAANTGAKGDNRNAMALADLQRSRMVNGRQDTLQGFYGALVADIGVNQQQAESSHTVEASLLAQASEYRDSVSGVNLDEEAANMLRFQQSYQAAAQIIKIADELFRTLLNSIG